jgi:type I restriction enzyme S subunit
MSEWKKYKLGDVITFQRGHDLTRIAMREGRYPVAGSNGIIGFHNAFTVKAPGVTIGRSGNIGTPHYYKSDYWAHNTVLFVKDFKLTEPLFIYYYLKTIDFTQFNAGSSVPTLNRNHIHELEIKLPVSTEQTAIAEVLSSLDDKIDLLHRQNKTLEQLAETLFRQWFVEDAEERWKDGRVLDLFKLQRGFDLPSQGRIEGKYPIVTSSGVNGTHNEYRIKGPGVTTGRSGLLGNVFYIDEDFWPLNTSLFINEYKIAKPLFAYFLLKTLDVASLNGGSAVPTLNRNDVHQLNIKIPPKELVDTFEASADTYFQKIKSNTNQIQTLIKLRDTLLPKLMSGEVWVEMKK